MRITAAQFERLVDEGLKLIPTEIRRVMDNVQIVIEDKPSDELLDDLGVPEDETIYGLYEGVPLTERTTEYGAFPDRIIIYQRPMLEDFDDEDELLEMDGDFIDLDAPIRDALILNLPVNPLCSEDCEGLCQTCGVKWADLPDDHAHAAADIRWAGLTDWKGPNS